MTEGETVVSECAQYDGGVHHVLLKAQEPHVQSLEPHQYSILFKTSKENRIRVFLQQGKMEFRCLRSLLCVYFGSGGDVFGLVCLYVCLLINNLFQKLLRDFSEIWWADLNPVSKI